MFKKAAAFVLATALALTKAEQGAEKMRDAAGTVRLERISEQERE